MQCIIIQIYLRYKLKLTAAAQLAIFSQKVYLDNDAHY